MLLFAYSFGYFLRPQAKSISQIGWFEQAVENGVCGQRLQASLRFQNAKCGRQKRVIDQLSAMLDERFRRQGMLTFYRLAVHEITGDFLS